MRIDEIGRILKAMRERSPATLRSALLLLEEALGEISPIDAVVLELPGARTFYVTRPMPGVPSGGVARSLGLEGVPGYRWIVIDGSADDASAEDGDSRSLSVTRIALHFRDRSNGMIYFLKSGEPPFGESSLDALSEIISSALEPFIPGSKHEAPRSGDSLRIELLESVRDDITMSTVLQRMMDRSGAEFIAYYGGLSPTTFQVMLESRELSIRIPEIREKLKTAFAMFSNRAGEGSGLREKIFFRNKDPNIAYLIGDSRMESYFLVPVTFDSRVRGVLFFGSVRDDAFTREDVAFFRKLAEEGEKETPIAFRIGGDLGILGQIVKVHPHASALVGKDGRIIFWNERFANVMRTGGVVPENICDLDGISSYMLAGLFEEFKTLGCDIVDREIVGATPQDGCVSASIVNLSQIAEETGSLLVVRDVSSVREEFAARDEMMAVVAHELRTPLTAVENSLKILLDGMGRSRAAGAANKHGAEARFLEIALRTMARLNVLVNGLIDSSGIRAGHSRLDLDRVDLRSFLEDSAVIYRASMEKKKIEYGVDVAPDASAAEIDRNKMEQIVQNLLSNSLRHVPSGGRIGIEVRSTAVIPGDPDMDIARSLAGGIRFARITVRDSGPGVPAAIADRINLRSRSGPEEDRRAGGLGLYIADKLIGLHGGSVVVGKGVKGGVVDLYFPADRMTGDAVRAVRSAREFFRKMTARGARPVLYIFEKSENGCWMEEMARWNISPVVNPLQGDAYCDFVFWPAGARYALGLKERDKEGPVAFLPGAKGYLRPLDRNGVISNLGWALFPSDGRSFGDLAASSLKMIEEGEIKSKLKGAEEWSTTGSS